MPIETSSESPDVPLSYVTGRTEFDATQLESDWVSISKKVRRATRRQSYLRFVRWFRAFSATVSYWPLMVLLFGPMIVGAATFILLHLLTGSYVIACYASLIGAAIGVGISCTLLYYPADRLLPAEIQVVEAQLTMLAAQCQQIASGIARRAALLQRNWKGLRGYDWENYLVEVFQAFGAKVQRTGQCGDQGCDLIVEFGAYRIAVQAKGVDDAHGVGNKAVQEAYTGMACWNCTRCAVITNSRFRKSAKTAAAGTGCVLIGENEFPEFVMGTVDLSSQF